MVMKSEFDAIQDHTLNPNMPEGTAHFSRLTH